MRKTIRPRRGTRVSRSTPGRAAGAPDRRHRLRPDRADACLAAGSRGPGLRRGRGGRRRTGRGRGRR